MLYGFFQLKSVYFPLFVLLISSIIKFFELLTYKKGIHLFKNCGTIPWWLLFFHEKTAHCLSLSHTCWLQRITCKTAIIPGLFYYTSMADTFKILIIIVLLTVRVIYTLKLVMEGGEWPSGTRLLLGRYMVLG